MEFRLLAGNSHIELAQKISQIIGIDLVKCKIDQFSNSEIRVLIDDGIASNLRNRDIVLIQTGSASNGLSVNDILMETMIMIDACKRSSCGKIILIMPCFPYARQDKKDRARCPISAKVVANMLENAGISRLVCMDLHSSQIAGFFNIPVDNLYSPKIIADYLIEKYFEKGANIADYVLVSPDAGGIKRMYHLARLLKISTVIMHKERNYDKKNVVEKTILIGEDNAVKDKICLIVDDMCDTAGTLCSAANTLIEYGAKEIKVVIAHGILSGPAIERLFNQPKLYEVITTNSLPLNEQLEHLQQLNIESYDKICEIYTDLQLLSDPRNYPDLWVKYICEEYEEQDKTYDILKNTMDKKSVNIGSLSILQVDIAPLLTEVIKRLNTGNSISALFED
jgi:ribose-phosphate pyrophosphokinase